MQKGFFACKWNLLFHFAIQSGFSIALDERFNHLFCVTERSGLEFLYKIKKKKKKNLRKNQTYIFPGMLFELYNQFSENF